MICTKCGAERLRVEAGVIYCVCCDNIFYSTDELLQAPPTKKGGKRDDLNNKYFRSSWEANFARYLNWQIAQGMIKEWKYEAREFTFPVKRGGRIYIPDFEVVENDNKITYYEVKGYEYAAGQTKIKRMAKYYPDVKLIVIDKDAYYSIASSMREIVPNWESGKKRG